jgi:hypothetical protein
MQALRIRPMTRPELDLGIEWAAQEGWNPGLHDADSFHAADPEGFLLGLLQDEPVGMISAVRYGARFGFIGFYIVRPPFRGQGHGISLWRAGMQRLAGRCIGLDGVVEQQASYRRSGFELAWNNVRYQGRARLGTRVGASVQALARLPLDAVLAYDAAFFPDERREFTRHWIAQTGSAALAVQRDGRMAGYGVVRPCRSGYKIGPLFADDAQAADELYCALVGGLERDAPVQLDIPAPNPFALDLVRSHGMQPVFETARMYVGGSPVLPVHRLFGVTTFELG